MGTMNDKAPTGRILAIPLDRKADLPLHRQISQHLRNAILTRRLEPGMPLPSSRSLAADLGVSRMTVTEAYNQLLSDRLIESHVGAGTRVARTPPLQIEPQPMQRQTAPLSERGRRIAAIPTDLRHSFGGRPGAFRRGVPSLDTFPIDVWGRITSRVWRNSPRSLLGYGDPLGYRPLRERLAEYLNAARGVSCTADQIMIVSGTQQALDIVTRMTMNDGDEAWIEDPCYHGARGALLANGARPVPVPVDEDGMCVDVGIERAPRARLAYVTPAAQMPLGCALSPARRAQLLDWANTADSWIIEDDYEGEYRYATQPVRALQAHPGGQSRVIYLGSFSKVLFPGLRLGYMVIPEALMQGFAASKYYLDLHSPQVQQAVLAEFIRLGHFERHIRRSRDLYEQRQKLLLAEADRLFQGLMEVRPVDAGMHVIGWLPHGTDDRVAARVAREHNVDVLPLSALSIEPTAPGLVLGFAAIDPVGIRQGAERLSTALRTIITPGQRIVSPARVI